MARARFPPCCLSSFFLIAWPYGANDAGEINAVPLRAAIATAIFNATGVRMIRRKRQMLKYKTRTMVPERLTNLEKTARANSNSGEEKTDRHDSDQNDMGGKDMHVIPVDIGNHAKFRIERQAKGRCQERQLNDNVD